MPSACTTVRGPAENQTVVVFCLSILEWCRSHPNTHFALYDNDGGERGLFCSREALIWVAVLFKNTNTACPREHVAKKTNLLFLVLSAGQKQWANSNSRWWGFEKNQANLTAQLHHLNGGPGSAACCCRLTCSVNTFNEPKDISPGLQLLQKGTGPLRGPICLPFGTTCPCLGTEYHNTLLDWMQLLSW